MHQHWTEQELADYRRAQMTPAERQAEAEKPTKADLRNEAELQSLAENELCRRGISYLHLSPRAREKAGWPDLTFCVQGAPFAVELKTPTGRLSDEQKDMLGRLRDNGWFVRICRDFDTFRRILNGDTTAGEQLPRKEDGKNHANP